MKKQLIVVSFIIVLFSGCELFDNDYTIYENHDITVCNIKDPLKNIKWVRDFCKKHTRDYNARVYAYRNTKTGEDCISIVRRDPGDYDRSEYYDCQNNLITSWRFASPPSPEFLEFSDGLESIGTIWSVNKIDDN
jgi:hypothetical protein